MVINGGSVCSVKYCKITNWKLKKKYGRNVALQQVLGFMLWIESAGLTKSASRLFGSVGPAGHIESASGRERNGEDKIDHYQRTTSPLHSKTVLLLYATMRRDNRDMVCKAGCFGLKGIALLMKTFNQKIELHNEIKTKTSGLKLNLTKLEKQLKINKGPKGHNAHALRPCNTNSFFFTFTQMSFHNLLEEKDLLIICRSDSSHLQNCNTIVTKFHEISEFRELTLEWKRKTRARGETWGKQPEQWRMKKQKFLEAARARGSFRSAGDLRTLGTLDIRNRKYEGNLEKSSLIVFSKNEAYYKFANNVGAFHAFQNQIYCRINKFYVLNVIEEHNLTLRFEMTTKQTNDFTVSTRQTEAKNKPRYDLMKIHARNRKPQHDAYTLQRSNIGMTLYLTDSRKSERFTKAFIEAFIERKYGTLTVTQRNMVANLLKFTRRNQVSVPEKSGQTGKQFGKRINVESSDDAASREVATVNVYRVVHLSEFI
ncbi:hypothetical protein WN51_02561 [Melipona quadrifasciata]|uniref:Uncharacterized protein n=1 Tax=Melipona quadrifasciata TaxID=166423 RepID=A0A0M8ZSZ6_9HYME|nr:hypothetical protein WN51_02561 [Melipona quadrifasciata]